MLRRRLLRISSHSVHVIRVILQVSRFRPQRLFVDGRGDDFLEAIPNVLFPEKVDESVEYPCTVREEYRRAGAVNRADEQFLLETEFAVVRRFALFGFLRVEAAAREAGRTCPRSFYGCCESRSSGS